MMQYNRREKTRVKIVKLYYLKTNLTQSNQKLYIDTRMHRYKMEVPTLEQNDTTWLTRWAFRKVEGGSNMVATNPRFEPE